ncbi:MAG TPA: carboxypeptidase-like regulatory domain-containing protein [Actinomycetota bacterium]|nr:carboxypeptidase-like regulatory domain-containing protein [Actinomycetota bacterium]
MPDRLRHLALVLAIAAVAIAPAPATAATRGTIKGRVVNESTGEPQPGVRVTLTSARDDGSQLTEQMTTTDERGRYVFEALRTGSDRFYAVDARYQQGLFAGGVLRIPSNTTSPPVIDSTLRVWDTTTDPQAIVIRRDSIFIVPSDDGIGVIEAVQVTNIADEAYIGRGLDMGAEDDGAVPSLGFPVPAGAELPPSPIVDSDIDIPEIVETSFGFAATIAIPPGNRRIVYSYELSGEGGTYDLTRPAVYPTLELGVYAADPLTIDGNRVAPSGTRDVQGKTYDFYESGETIEAGDRLQMIAVAEASASNLLAIGGGIAAVLVLAAGLVVLLRRRRPRTAGPSREELVEAIARLDLAKEQGLVSEDEWGPRRADLKRRLERMSSPEVTA